MNIKPSDKDKEKAMSTSEAGTNSQKDMPDEEPSVSFVTEEEKDAGFSSKTNIDQGAGESSTKKQRRSEKDKDNSFEMELMIQQITTVAREFEKHEFWNVTDVLGENGSTEIGGVISNMIFLAETAGDIDNVLSQQLVLYEKLKKKTEKQISNEAMHDSFLHTPFTKGTFLG